MGAAPAALCGARQLNHLPLLELGRAGTGDLDEAEQALQAIDEALGMTLEQVGPMGKPAGAAARGG